MGAPCCSGPIVAGPFSKIRDTYLTRKLQISDTGPEWLALPCSGSAAQEKCPRPQRRRGALRSPSRRSRTSCSLSNMCVALCACKLLPKNGFGFRKADVDFWEGVLVTYCKPLNQSTVLGLSVVSLYFLQLMMRCSFV